MLLHQYILIGAISIKSRHDLKFELTCNKKNVYIGHIGKQKKKKKEKSELGRKANSTHKKQLFTSEFFLKLLSKYIS